MRLTFEHGNSGYYLMANLELCSAAPGVGACTWFKVGTQHFGQNSAYGKGTVTLELGHDNVKVEFSGGVSGSYSREDLEFSEARVACDYLFT